jgi:hypothetical protein
MAKASKTTARSNHPWRRPTQRAAVTEIAIRRYNHGALSFSNAPPQIQDTAIKAMISLFFVPERGGAFDRDFIRFLFTLVLKGCRAELLSLSTVPSGRR